MLLSQMLRLTLTYLIASRNPKQEDLDDTEPEICVREKQIAWREGDCGVRLNEGKHLFPNFKELT